MNENTFLLYNDDCFNCITGVPNNSIDMIVTDPPYIISQKTNFNKGGGNEKKYGMINMDFGEWDKQNINFYQLLKEYNRVLKSGGSMIIFFDIFKMETIFNISQELKLKQPRIGIWNKVNAVPINARINYLSNAREYFISLTKGKKNTFNSYYDKAFYNFPIVGGKEKTIHPTQKPVKLLEEIIKVNSNEGDVILDTFMGSGSTGVACANTNRRFIGIELNENYFKIAQKRIEDIQLQLTLF